MVRWLVVVAALSTFNLGCSDNDSESSCGQLRTELTAIESTITSHSGDPTWSDIVEAHETLNRRAEVVASMASQDCFH